MFSQHCKSCRALGFSESKIQAIKAWQVSDEFTRREKALLAYTDALVLGFGRVDDGIFDAMREEGLEPQVCLTVPLLVGLDGHEKMSKSLGNAIAVEDPPREIYGKTMSVPDALMWDWLLLLTDLPAAEIDRRRAAVAVGTLHPKAVKQELARALVGQYHGAAEAAAAEAEFERVFAGGGRPDEVAELELAPAPLADLLVAAGLAASKNEARRLVEQGAVSIDGERAGDARLELAARSEPYQVRAGKRRFAALRLRRP